jgi:L-amino acid N-acyltransferase YncA
LNIPPTASSRPMTPATHVRPAMAKDLPQILGFLRQLTDAHARYDPQRFIPPTDAASTYGAWLAQATPGSDVLALVVQIGPDRPVVGYLIAEHFEPMPKYWAPACIYVHDIFIDPAARSTGAADALLAHAESWGKIRGVHQLRAIVAEANQMGQSFFARRGFRVGAMEFVRG